MDGLAWVNHEIIDLRDATVPLMDRGYLLGDGIYETLRTAQGEVFRPAEHRERFQRGCKELGLSNLEAEYDAAVDGLVRAGHELGDDLYLRINLTPGAMEDVATGNGAVITGICKPFKPYPMRHYSQGIKIETSKRRHPGGSGAKTISMHLHAAARRDALANGVHDALMLDGENIVEATTSNVFALVAGVVHAPGSERGAVDGVTRRVVLELIGDDYPIKHSLTRTELQAASEIWLTNSIGGVVPVATMDGREIGKGPVATKLMHQYEDLVRGR